MFLSSCGPGVRKKTWWNIKWNENWERSGNNLTHGLLVLKLYKKDLLVVQFTVTWCPIIFTSWPGCGQVCFWYSVHLLYKRINLLFQDITFIFRANRVLPTSVKHFYRPNWSSNRIFGEFCPSPRAPSRNNLNMRILRQMQCVNLFWPNWSSRFSVSSVPAFNFGFIKVSNINFSAESKLCSFLHQGTFHWPKWSSGLMECHCSVQKCLRTSWDSWITNEPKANRVLDP